MTQPLDDAARTRLDLAPEPLADLWRSADVVALTVAPGEGEAPPVPGALAGHVATALGLDLAVVTAAEKASGRAGELTRLPVPPADGLPARLFLLGTGAGTPRDLRRAGAALARAGRGRARVVTDLGAGAGDGAVRAAVEGLLLGGWAPPAAGLKDRSESAPAGEVLLDPALPAAAVDLGRVHAGATLTARLLAATPSDVKTPDWVARFAQDAAAEAGLDVEVWDEQRLAAEGFGGLVAVGGAAASPPRLVRLSYTPEGADADRPVVLVGKGITFDTGGLAIKPREAMLPMRTDMSGAGAVLAVLAGCRAAGVRRRVVGLLPLAENSVGAASYRPGDVIRHYGGGPPPGGNNDAQGRGRLAPAPAPGAAPPH